MICYVYAKRRRWERKSVKERIEVEENGLEKKTTQTKDRAKHMECPTLSFFS